VGSYRYPFVGLCCVCCVRFLILYLYLCLLLRRKCLSLTFLHEVAEGAFELTAVVEEAPERVRVCLAADAADGSIRSRVNHRHFVLDEREYSGDEYVV
jgi:hypothetical protein